MRYIRLFESFVNGCESPEYVYRIDPVDRSGDLWKRSDYAVLGSGGVAQGTAPLKPGQEIGDSVDGYEIIDIERGIAFATPHRPNSFYAACPRKGKDGSPVSGTAVYDEDRMYGSGLDLGYRGTLYMTQDDWDNMPDSVAVSRADGAGWCTKKYSGMDEATCPYPASNVMRSVERTEDLVRSQYDVMIYPDQESVDAAVAADMAANPGMSMLKQ